MTTQQITTLETLLNREIFAIGCTYYVDLTIGGSYLLPLVKMNKTSAMIYTQTWEKINPESQNYIIEVLKNYGREVVKNKKTRIVDGFSGGCETVTIIPAQTTYIVWQMDLIKDLSGILSSYKKYIEFEY